MTMRVNIGLSYDAWPEQDQKLWAAAVEGDDIFDDRPMAALAKSTIYGRLASYRQWMGFLDVTSPETLRLPLAERVTAKSIEDYVGYLRQNCRETSIVIDLERLFFVVRALCPEVDWTWLYRIGRRIAQDARPIKHPKVEAPKLYELGLSLMSSSLAKAEKAGDVNWACALRFRDGLQIAFLIEAPVRRGALSRLTLGAHLQKIDRTWWVTVPAELSKTKTPQNFELSLRLSGYIDVYLMRFRSIFPGAEAHNGLWPYIGRPMTDKMIRRRIRKRTLVALGVAVSPHRFRTAAATFLVSKDPENARAARDLLGHKSFTMTQKHYVNRAQSRLAGHKLASVQERLRNGG